MARRLAKGQIGHKKTGQSGAGSSVGVRWLVGQSVKVDQKSN